MFERSIVELVVEAIVYLYNEVIKKCVLFVAFAYLLPPKGGIGLFLWKRKDWFGTLCGQS